MEMLNKGNMKFSTNNLKFFAQPFVHQPELYWKSYDDFLIFVQLIANNRRIFPGEKLLELFNEALPHIMAIENFEDANLPFETITQGVADRYLRPALEHAGSFMNKVVYQPFLQMTPEELLKSFCTEQYGPMIKFIQKAFQEKLQAIVWVQDLLVFCSKQIDEYDRIMATAVEEAAKTAYQNACCAALLPFLREKEWTELKREIEAVSESGIPVEVIGFYSFADLSGRYQQKAKSDLKIVLLPIDNTLLNDANFLVIVGEISDRVSKTVKDIEKVKKMKYEEYPKKYEEEKRKKLEEKFKAEQDRQKRELTEMEKRHLEEMQRQRQADEARIAKMELQRREGATIFEEAIKTRDAQQKAERECDIREQQRKEENFRFMIEQQKAQHTQNDTRMAELIRDNAEKQKRIEEEFSRSGLEAIANEARTTQLRLETERKKQQLRQTEDEKGRRRWSSSSKTKQRDFRKRSELEMLNMLLNENVKLENRMSRTRPG
jgi:hypothetical protein